MTQEFARNACPSLAAPMQTGDGLLVRLLPATPIPVDAFIGLCRATRAHGNGTVEISARGSLQLRGLSPQSAPLFAAAVAALGIELCESIAIVADPLPGDPSLLTDSAVVALALRRAIAQAGLRLAPKVSVLIDGRGSIDLDAISADVRLRAVATDYGPRFRLSVAGNAATAAELGAVAPEHAAEAVLDLLQHIAALGPRARAADLLPVAGAALKPTLPSSHRAEPIGAHMLDEGTCALGLGLAFGHAQAENLLTLALIAKAHGAEWCRPAPARALLLGPLRNANAHLAREMATGLGFVTATSDPRCRIAACPGAPFCPQGLIAARDLAGEIAQEVALPAGSGIAVHISGCAKGCAHPARAPLTIVGTEKGCAVIRNGTARATPASYIEPAKIVSALSESENTREAVHA